MRTLKSFISESSNSKLQQFYDILIDLLPADSYNPSWKSREDIALKTYFEKGIKKFCKLNGIKVKGIKFEKWNGGLGNKCWKVELTTGLGDSWYFTLDYIEGRYSKICIYDSGNDREIFLMGPNGISKDPEAEVLLDEIQ